MKQTSTYPTTWNTHTHTLYATALKEKKQNMMQPFEITTDHWNYLIQTIIRSREKSRINYLDVKKQFLSFQSGHEVHIFFEQEKQNLCYEDLVFIGRLICSSYFIAHHGDELASQILKSYLRTVYAFIPEVVCYRWLNNSMLAIPTGHCAVVMLEHIVRISGQLPPILTTEESITQHCRHLLHRLQTEEFEKNLLRKFEIDVST